MGASRRRKAEIVPGKGFEKGIGQRILDYGHNAVVDGPHGPADPALDQIFSETAGTKVEPTGSWFLQTGHCMGLSSQPSRVNAEF